MLKFLSFLTMALARLPQIEDFVDSSGNIDVSGLMDSVANDSNFHSKTSVEVFREIDLRWYLILVITILVSLVIWFVAKWIINKYSFEFSQRMISANEAAKAMLTSSCVYGVNVVSVAGELTDHFDSGANEIRLSDKVYNNSSVAAVGIACHEAGHAIQYAYGSPLIKARSIVAGICDSAWVLSVVAVIITLVFGLYEEVYFFSVGGIVSYVVTTLFKLFTLPVEFDASRRALDLMKRANILEENEIIIARKVLSACALTYVASTLTSIILLLKMIIKSRKRY